MSWSALDLKDLADEFDTLQEAKDRLDEGESQPEEETDWDPERYKALSDLNDELGTDDLHEADNKGFVLISQSDWKSYCQEQAEELYLNGNDNPLFAYIDWQAWADACESDYDSVDFDGDTYYYREP